jgi:hypothetical protein
VFGNVAGILGKHKFIAASGMIVGYNVPVRLEELKALASAAAAAATHAVEEEEHLPVKI